MWHLISIAITRIRNIWLWAQQHPFPVVVVLHSIFLSACCVRYVSSITIQLRKKAGGATLLTNVRPHAAAAFCAKKSEPGVSLISKLAPHKETKIQQAKKQTVKKVPQQAKKIVTKNVKKDAPKKNEKLVPEKKKKEIVQPVVEPKAQAKPEKPVATPVQQPVTPVIPSEIQIGAQVGELLSALVSHEAMTAGELLHARILEIWKPPRNVRTKLPCVVRVIVGKGLLETKPEIVTSSGSSAFDMSARRALLEIKYPPELWNRAITIHFS